MDGHPRMKEAGGDWRTGEYVPQILKEATAAQQQHGILVQQHRPSVGGTLYFFKRSSGSVILKGLQKCLKCAQIQNSSKHFRQKKFTSQKCVTPLKKCLFDYFYLKDTERKTGK